MPRNVLITSPLVAKIAGMSRFRASVFCQAFSNGSENFIAWDIKIGICAACHPFFTGEQKFVDTAGRVEKFARRYGSTKAARAEKKA